MQKVTQSSSNISRVILQQCVTDWRQEDQGQGRGEHFNRREKIPARTLGTTKRKKGHVLGRALQIEI